MKEEILEDIGFSKSETVVYLALLKLGKTKSGNVIKITGLQSSVVHNSLNTLSDKGFVSHILEGKIKHYVALDPQLIGKYIDSKKQEFNAVLPELKELQKLSLSPVTAEVYEGFNGLYTATLKMIEDARNGDIYKYFAAEKTLLTKGAIEFFSKVDMLKKSKKIIVKGIAQTKDRNLLKDYTNSEIKFVSKEIPPAMNICKDKILLISLSEKPTGILIHSKEIAKQYHELWDSLWKASN